MQKLLRIFLVALLGFTGLSAQAQQGTFCMNPTIIGAIPDSTSVKITWVSNSIMTVPATYTVERTAYPATSSSTWVSATVTPTPTPAGGLNYTATGLVKCTNYVFRVKANCTATVSSTWSTPFIAKTTGCVVAPPVCTIPTFISVSTDSTSATLSWTGSVQGTTYTLEYTTAPATNNSTWTAVNATANSKTVTGLSACTVYIFRVKANCSATVSSGWSLLRDTKTKGCVVIAPCFAPTVAVVTDSTKAILTWGNGTAPSAGTTYTIQYTALPTSSSSTWTTVTATGSPFTVTGLATCKEYAFRVKANCSATTSSNWSTTVTAKTKGCVVITPCFAPNIVSTVTDSTKATLTWISSSVAAGTTFTVEYTTIPVSSNNVWTAVAATASPFTVTGLTACTEYVFRVKANCSATTSSNWSNFGIGKTKGCVVVVPCLAPVIGNITTDSTKATLTWGNGTAPSAGTTYTIEYTVAPLSAISTWTAVTATTNTATITGLSACTNYIFRVKAHCSATTSSTWSANRDSKTKGCVVVVPCTTPFIGNITADSTKISFSWSAGSAGTTYIVEYAAAPVTTTSTWTAVTATTNSVTITGLATCTTYAVRVKAICSATTSSAWSNVRDTKTKGCIVVVPCSTPFIGNITADSTKATLAWGNGTAPSAGTTYTIEYTVAPVSATSTWTAVTATTNAATITGLSTCTNYVFRVKANCSATTSSAWSNIRDTKTKGCVVIAPCLVPSIANVTTDSTKATVSWVSPSPSTGAASYTLEYTALPINNTSIWTAVSATTTSTIVTGLATCKEYAFRVKANCTATTSSAWSIVRIGKTKGCAAATCTKPTNLASTFTNTSATFTWAGSGSFFQVRYRAFSGSTSWNTIDSITTNTATANNLKKCNTYIWQVRARCANSTWTPWSDYKVFKTTGCTSAQNLTVAPNPSTGLNLTYTLPAEGKVSVEVVNIQGSVIKTLELGTQYAGDNQFMAEDMDIQSGIYFIVMKIDGVQQQVQRWIKE